VLDVVKVKAEPVGGRRPCDVHTKLNRHIHSAAGDGRLDDDGLPPQDWVHGLAAASFQPTSPMIFSAFVMSISA
jgi:hypothetical protein